MLLLLNYYKSHLFIVGPVQQTQLVAVLTKQTESGTSEVEVQVLGDEAALLEATGLTLSEDGQLTQVKLI